MTVFKFIEEEAVFIGANRQAYVADYNQAESLVAFGASNTIALWDPIAKDKKGVYSTLKQHTKEITGIRFIPGTPYFVSVGEDSQINVWKNEGSSFTLHQSINYHEDSITCLSVIDERVFATGSADGFIALWGFSEAGNVNLIHEFQVRFNFYPLALALQDIDENGNYLLAVGGTTFNLFIYSFQLSSNNSQISHFNQAAAMTGHEDWIKCLSFVADTKHKSYILASGAQDRYIRLWRLRLNDLIDDSDEDELKLILLSNKQYKFTFNESAPTPSRAAFSFEALIMGHDDWVTGLQWHPSYLNDSPNKKLQLLSSSADTALMIWEMDDESGIWCCVNRLGEMSIKGASTATGASGGFWSCLWFLDNNQKQYILANGKTGSFRLYESKDEEAKTFESTLAVTGSTREITDVVWSKNGDYFTATSLDQTTRLFAPWVAGRDFKTWHEFARPQIHGYDMVCMDNITNTKFVSGGDEKILRVFEITNSISSLLKKHCNIDIQANDDALPESASLPVLGLSNKAANEAHIEDGQVSQQQEDEANNVSAATADDDILATLNGPPLEDHLQRYTLFPEIEKLYGHGYEITCTATSPSGRLIASACRSNSAKHAVVRIFDSEDEYKQLDQLLEGHTLTITSLEFSPDGQYLIAVSRDRSFTLWKVVDEAKGSFELVQLKEKAHTRIIWDCSWAPQNKFGQFFVTGSRDKQIKLWQIGQTEAKLIASSKVADPVTSVACFQESLLSGNKLSIAVGTESGSISLYSVNLEEESKDFVSNHQFDTIITPAGRINKLSFSPHLHENGNKLILAVGSVDSSVRVYSIEKSIVA